MLGCDVLNAVLIKTA